MNQTSKKSTINIAIAALLALLVAKAVWVFMQYKVLPKSGVDLPKSSGLKKLFYHYNLASKKDKPKIVKNNNPRPQPPKPKIEKITKFILKGIYNAQDKKVILVDYQGKSYALNLGESIEGYKFVRLYPDHAIFKKDGKEYRLDLFKKNKQSRRSYSQPVHTVVNNTPQPKKNKKVEPIKEGDTTIIPKTLFNKYKGDYRAIRRNINAVPNMVNGKLNGFKISFVRRGSDFDKLGLKRGDIITAINGEPLDNFRVPLEFFNNADSLTAATLTIKRGNEIKELEYEVR